MTQARTRGSQLAVTIFNYRQICFHNTLNEEMLLRLVIALRPKYHHTLKSETQYLVLSAHIALLGTKSLFNPLVFLICLTYIQNHPEL